MSAVVVIAIVGLSLAGLHLAHRREQIVQERMQRTKDCNRAVGSRRRRVVTVGIAVGCSRAVRTRRRVRRASGGGARSGRGRCRRRASRRSGSRASAARGAVGCRAAARGRRLGNEAKLTERLEDAVHQAEHPAAAAIVAVVVVTAHSLVVVIAVVRSCPAGLSDAAVLGHIRVRSPRHP